MQIDLRGRGGFYMLYAPKKPQNMVFTNETNQNTTDNQYIA